MLATCLHSHSPQVGSSTFGHLRAWSSAEQAKHGKHSNVGWHLFLPAGVSWRYSPFLQVGRSGFGTEVMTVLQAQFSVVESSHLRVVQTDSKSFPAASVLVFGKST
jgi:hypothetical protein